MTITGQTKVRKLRLAIVVSHPIQYYTPLYRRLAEREVVKPHVVFLSDAGAREHVDSGFGRKVAWDIPLLEGYEYTVLQPGSSVNTRGFWGRHDVRLNAKLEEISPDWLLLYGYASRMNWSALRWANKHNVKVAYASDSNIHDPRRRYIQPIKKFLVQQFFLGIDAFLSTSEANLAYLREFGAPISSIYRLPFAIEVERFHNNTSTLEADRTYDFIWAGKFIPLKRPQDFLAALPRVVNTIGRPIKTCIVGDGPLRPALEAQAAGLPASCSVEFLGFVNQAAMPATLQRAHTLVFSSEQEAYGLIATEAAAAGLALIVSDRIGCVGSTVLARPGVNAVTYRAGDVKGLADAMSALMLDATRLTSMQQASWDIAQSHDVDHAVNVIESIILGSDILEQ